MGAIFVREEDPDGRTVHVATGKYPFAQGEKHYPDWSHWMGGDYPGMERRECLWRQDLCDQEEWRGKA